MELLTAKQLAIDYLTRECPQFAPGELVILDQFTVDTPQYWVFFYQSRGWVEKRELKRRLVGNLPVAVDKQDGWTHVVARGGSIEGRLEHLSAYRMSQRTGGAS